MASQLLVEPYEVSESRVKQEIDILLDRGDDNLNLAAAARECQLGGWSAIGRTAIKTNKRISEDEELAVCLHLDRPEAIFEALHTRACISRAYFLK